PLSSLIRPDGMAPKPWWFRTTSHSCRCRRAHPNSTARKTSGSSCVRIGCQTGFSNPSTISSTIAATLGTHSSTNPGSYVHRATRLGSSRSLNLRIGISSAVGSKVCALLQGCRQNLYHCGMFIIPHGAPEGYEWFVALVVLVGLYFAVHNLMRARR